MKIRFLFFPAIAVFLFSCRSVPQDVAYFQDFDEYVKSHSISTFSRYESTIKSGDQLFITVSSPVWDQTQVAQFNLPVNTFLTPGTTQIGQSMAVQTYMVDKNGDIYFPIVGKLHLDGLKRSEAIDLITRKVSESLHDPIINLQIISFKVSVLGEVLKPGPIIVTDERISIFEALGAAGDLTIYGDRKNVILLRDNNGLKELHKFDLTRSDDIFTSPYYYLQQNDVVYVEPNATRKKESKFGTGESYTLSILSISFTAVSILISLFGILIKK
ncbi:MAG: polysaccharide biosynthesis/export family protein [Dysgonamonadaceae bacterium]|jgi:polysaccharide export outer membrane protein|nr:polysaccharide biosynthesis/export family protein [Dysgonamonadaceae bacterium]